MTVAIALGLLLLLTSLATLFVIIAVTIRRDCRTRFARLAERLEHEAFTIVRQLLGRG